MRNGAFNFGYHVNSDGGGMMGGFYDRENVLSSGAGGPSEDSSFLQFNDRNGSSSFVDNEDTV